MRLFCLDYPFDKGLDPTFVSPAAIWIVHSVTATDSGVAAALLALPDTFGNLLWPVSTRESRFCVPSAHGSC